MNKADIVLALCLSFMVGIFFAPFLLVAGIFLILGLSLICVFFFRDKKIAIAGFCFLFLALGIFRHGLSLEKKADSELMDFNDTKKEIILEGTVIREPDIRSDKVQLTVGDIQPQNCYENGPCGISGKILVVADKYIGYQYGDRLKISGQLKTPAIFEDFSYRDYLAKDGIYSVIYWPKIEILDHKQASVVFSAILSFKDRIRAKIHEFLKPPQSIILAAMMLGDKSRMSDELKEKLARTGLSHITAISGMHIAILSGVLMQVFIGLGLWRKQAFYFTLVILVFFIIMIGAPASATRAGVMGGFLLLAEKTGRLNQSWRGLILAAAIMLAVNPLLLKSDIGFQLSFLAILSIICFFDFFEKKLNFLPMRKTVAMTLSAQIMVWPVLVYNFGQFSIVAPLTNILVVPLVAAILIAGFFGGLFSMVLPFLGTIVFFPAWIVLSYTLKIIDWFSALPFSAIVSKNIHWGWVVVYYAVVFVIYRYWIMPRAKSQIKITPPVFSTAGR